MERKSIVNILEEMKQRLHSDVVSAYEERGHTYGSVREKSWIRLVSRFLRENLPTYVKDFEHTVLPHISFGSDDHETPGQHYWRLNGHRIEAFIDSMIEDVKSNVHMVDSDLVHEVDNQTESDDSASSMHHNNQIFIVHGHDHEFLHTIARFLSTLEFDVIILAEQASGGSTIIEKIEEHTDVGYAVVLYTPDDVGNTVKEAESGNLKGRARQNVIFEHGYLFAKIGRDRVATVVSGDVELPSDISGVVYQSEKEWKLGLAKELRKAGYQFDMEKILK